MPALPTLESLPIDAIDRVVPMLQKSVDALANLRACAELSHVNVRGPARVGLHKRFDQLYDIANAHKDVLAERIFQLGELVAPSAIALKPTANPDGMALCKMLSEEIRNTLIGLEEARDVANEENDFDSFDSLVDATRALKKIGADILSHLG